jgi:hypothetical protein
MKFVMALLLCLCSMFAHAGDGTKYTNTIWVYTHDYVYLFQTCWTVVDHPDYFGNYCYGEFYEWGVPSPSPNITGQYFDMVIGITDASSPGLIDENKECYLFRKDTIHGDGVAGDDTEYNTYYIQCGDYIFNNGFEDHSGNPPGE